MLDGTMRSLRKEEARLSLLGASRLPLIFSPDAFFPENVNTGMTLFLLNESRSGPYLSSFARLYF
jgi:hypothetical protein